ncbi:hypothetical protein, partial [Rhodococcus sp. (in: high G+C Gram-positive bacteria)]|uniref:hypothetical protein n=1 Tax=Rhodococcus sp. TaxID=1831 RepID=UPI002E25A851
QAAENGSLVRANKDESEPDDPTAADVFVLGPRRQQDVVVIGAARELEHEPKVRARAGQS